MVRVFYGHFLSDDPEVRNAGYRNLVGCLVYDNQYAPKIMAPGVLTFLEATLQSTLPDRSRVFCALGLLAYLYRSLSKAQRQVCMSMLARILQVYKDGDDQLEVLFRMKEIWSADANPRATFPEAFELLDRMKRSPSLDSRLTDAIDRLCFRC